MRWLVVAVIFLTVFGIFTTVYAIAARPNEVRVLPKWLWVIMCAALPLIGGLLYLTLGRPLAPGTGTTGRGRQTRVVAPDDDPNFLRDLNRRLNKDSDPAAAKDESAATDSDTPDSATDAGDSADSATGDSADTGNDEDSADGDSGDGGKPSAT